MLTFHFLLKICDGENSTSPIPSKKQSPRTCLLPAEKQKRLLTYQHLRLFHRSGGGDRRSGGSGERERGTEHDHAQERERANTTTFVLPVYEPHHNI